MKKNFKETFNIIIYTSFIISIISNIMINKNNILNNNTKILKEMSESTQITDLNKNIEQLNSSHTEYANYIQSSKQSIANAINLYSNNNATSQNSLDEFSSMITNLTNIPENTYYYQSGTEGDSSTIIRYKKVGEKYYLCDEHGAISSGTTATDISTLTLIPYSATFSSSLSAGSASYSHGIFYLGDGTNNAAYYAQGVIDGMNNALDNLNIQYTYHVHEGSSGKTANGCYTTPVYHSHVFSCYCSVGLQYTGSSGSTSIYWCSGCQRNFYLGDGGEGKFHNSPCHYTTGSGRAACGKTTTTAENFILGCGKTEETIESVKIIY